MQVQIGQQARHPLRKHGLAHSRRAVEEHVVPPGRRDLAGPLGLHLANHVGQVELASGSAGRRDASDLDGLDLRHRVATQQRHQLRDRCHTEHLDPLHQVCLARLAERHDHAREAGLGGGQGGRTDPAHRADPAIQPELAEQYRVPQLFPRNTFCAASTAATMRRS